MASRARSNGVTEYTTGTLEFQVGFPKGEEACEWCPLCISDPLMRSRHRCLDTGAIIFDVRQLDKECRMKLDNEVE